MRLRCRYGDLKTIVFVAIGEFVHCRYGDLKTIIIGETSLPIRRSIDEISLPIRCPESNNYWPDFVANSEI